MVAGTNCVALVSIVFSDGADTGCAKKACPLPLKVGPEMKRPLAVFSPPGIAVSVAIIGLIVIAFDLFHERAGGATYPTTALAALAAGATVSPTERAWVAPSGGAR